MSSTLATTTSSVDSKHFFTKSDHALRVTSNFSLYLQQEFLCDVVFICNNGQKNRRIVAHRLILSMLSDYFRSMFENNVQSEIVLNNIDPDIFQKFIRYAYEGRIDIHSNNVTKILNIAYIFQITEIVEICSKLIKRQIQPMNCLGLYKLAIQHDLQDLIQTIWNYILDHFSEIVQNNPEFLELSFDEIKQILASDDINIHTEEIVYEAFISWLDHDLNRQNNQLAELFSLIRLPLIDRKYLTDFIDTNNRFENDNSCQMLIIEAMRYHLSPEKRSYMKSIRTKPRKSTLGFLYCLGGIDNDKNPQRIEQYNFRTRSWQTDGHLNNRRCQFACIRLDTSLYICGGRNGLKTLNSIEIYDLKTKTSTIGPSMQTNRYDLGVACIGNPLYAIGGHDGRTILSTVERFDPKTDEWTYVASMIDARCTLGVAVIENRIYAVGGKNDSTSLRESESFDPHTNRWSQCASMQKRRDSVAVVSCNGFLYAIGGQEFSINNKSVIRHDDGECYDPKCNQWTLITSFSRPKQALAIAEVNNKLYIVGGFNGKVLNEMERYDTESDEWTKCPPLRTKRAGACLIHVPNSHQNNRHVLP